MRNGPGKYPCEIRRFGAGIESPPLLHLGDIIPVRNQILIG